MVINYIECECDCKNPQNDVLGKITFLDEKKKKITKILTKCMGCKHQHILDEDDDRCKKFFKK